MNVRTLVALAVSVLLVGTGTAAAQEGEVTGTVRSESGQAMPNATVMVAGTDVGALTDDQGRFSFTLEPGSYEVRARLIGYSTSSRQISVEAGATTTVSLVIRPQAVAMGELVATVGARVARRQERGTDIETLDAAEAVEQSTGEDVSDILNARIPGVGVSEASGEVGTASLIRVRGATSLTQDNNPLVYVDGVRVGAKTGTGPRSRQFPEGQTISRLDDLNPLDMANIQVIKGPTATALYGAEAASGVVLIETKRGESGETNFRFMTQQGFNEDRNEYDTQYINLTQVAGVTDPGRPDLQPWNPVTQPVTGDVLARFNPLEDPRTTPFQKGRISRYHLSASAAPSEQMNYYVSGRWDDLEGTLSPQSVDRISGRVNLEAQVLEDLQLSVSAGYIDNTIGVSSGDRNTTGWITNGGAGFPLFSFEASESGCLATVALGLPPSACEQEGNFIASFDDLTDKTQQQAVNRFISSATLSYQPADWWTNRLTTGVDYHEATDLNQVVPNPELPFGGISRGIKDKIVTQDQILTVDFASTANLELSDSWSTTMSAGVQGFLNQAETVACSGSIFASADAMACQAGLSFEGFETQSEINELGAFLQQEVGFRDYLFLTGALRVDDSSAFGAAQGAIWSPSANVSAVLSDMPFWNVDFLNEFRLRGAWGRAAQAPDPFAARQTLLPVRVNSGGEDILGISPLNPGNPNLTAERSEEFEVGFDAVLLDGRFDVKLTYFDAELTDAIFPSRVAPSTGFSGVRFINIGSVTNQGLEAALNGVLVDRENFRWSMALQASTVDPLIEDLGDADPILGCTSAIQSNSGIFVEGLAPGTYCGRVITEAERADDGSIVPGSVVEAPGNIPELEGTGLRDLGHQTPTNTQSLSTTITLFDNLRIYTLANRKAGFSKFWSTGGFGNPFIRNQTFFRKWAFRYAESTPEEQEMMDREGDFNTSVFVQEGDFIRWRELSVTYDLPMSVVEMFGPVRAASLQLGVKNLAVSTDYEGVDPEARVFGATDNFNNTEFFTQGPVRNYTARLSVAF